MHRGLVKTQYLFIHEFYNGLRSLRFVSLLYDISFYNKTCYYHSWFYLPAWGIHNIIPDHTLTHLPLVPYIYIYIYKYESALVQMMVATWMAPSHYLNQCVILTIAPQATYIFQWNFIFEIQILVCEMEAIFTGKYELTNICNVINIFRNIFTIIIT